jgi:hypothetical protein
MPDSENNQGFPRQRGPILNDEFSEYQGEAREALRTQQGGLSEAFRRTAPLRGRVADREKHIL